MADIRPFQRADLPAVLALLRTQMRGWTLDPPLFAGLILGHHWVDEELPSLVAVGPRIMPSAFPYPTPGVAGEDATAATIVEHLPALNKRLRVWVDHDEEHLEHLFGLW